MKPHIQLFAGIALAALTTIATTSCTDEIKLGSNALEKPSGSTVTKDTVFNSPIYTEQFLNSIYALQYYGLPYNPSCGTSASPWSGKFDQLTDCWVMHWDNNTIYKAYYSGTLDANQEPLLSYKNDNVWKAVRAAWLLIENINNVPGLSEEKKQSFTAQARCLIAARYFDLFAVYGGLPIIDHSYSGTEGSYDMPRATLDSTVTFMVDQLDQAINSGALPWAYNGNTTETDATNNTGRWTKAGAMALKAKILTFAASPIYNAAQGYYGGSSEAEQKHMVWYGDFKQERWEKALKACQDFFDALNANGWYELTQAESKTPDGYRQAYRMGYAYQGSKEILHSTRVGGVDAYKSGTYTWHQWLDNPARQNCLPTEEYVEMFPWADGTPFDWKSDSIKGKVEGAKGQLFYKYEKVRGGFKKTASRDPRLYEECIVNGQMTSLDWTTGKSNGDVYELWVGGADAGNAVARYDETSKKIVKTEALTKRYATGYDQNKYYMNQDYLRKFTQWVYLSLDEMYLMYAECLAQCDRLDDALKQVDIVRARVGLKGLALKNPSLDLHSNKQNLINEILRERACELGLSNNHYYDMIRYKRGDWMTKKLHGLITYRMEQGPTGGYIRQYIPWRGANKDGGAKEPTRFEYEKFTIQNRQHYLWDKDPQSQEVAKWYLWPFPKTEINKHYGLVQNPGWE